MDERQYYCDERQQSSCDRQYNCEDNNQSYDDRQCGCQDYQQRYDERQCGCQDYQQRYDEKQCSCQDYQQRYDEKQCSCQDNNKHYEMQYSLKEEYPKVYVDNKRCGNNRKDLEMLQILYCSQYGEVTAIMQYLQQYFVFDCKYDEVANIIKYIAAVEMHHMELIGEAIVALGGSAKYINIQEHQYWNGGMVSYSSNLCKELMGNLKAETEAYKTYLNFAERTQNYSLKALYKRIAMDEKLHIDIFTQLINKYCR